METYRYLSANKLPKPLEEAVLRTCLKITILLFPKVKYELFSYYLLSKLLISFLRIYGKLYAIEDYNMQY